MTYTADFAAVMKDRAGEQYIPSNGTEGEVFFSEWCCRCSKDISMRDGEPLDECDDNEVCPIIGASFRGEAKEWIYGPDGQPMCTVFHEFGTPATYRCTNTSDMFGSDQ